MRLAQNHHKWGGKLTLLTHTGFALLLASVILLFAWLFTCNHLFLYASALAALGSLVGPRVEL